MSRFQSSFSIGYFDRGHDLVPDVKTGELVQADPCFCATCRFSNANGRRVVRRPWERYVVESIPVGESRVIDSYVDQTDINKIIERFDRTGVLPEGKQGQFIDVTELQGDYTALHNKALETMARAEELNTEANAAKRAKAAKPSVEASDSDLSPGSESSKPVVDSNS